MKKYHPNIRRGVTTYPFYLWRKWNRVGNTGGGGTKLDRYIDLEEEKDDFYKLFLKNNDPSAPRWPCRIPNFKKRSLRNLAAIVSIPNYHKQRVNGFVCDGTVDTAHCRFTKRTLTFENYGRTDSKIFPNERSSPHDQFFETTPVATSCCQQPATEWHRHQSEMVNSYFFDDDRRLIVGLCCMYI